MVSCALGDASCSRLVAVVMPFLLIAAASFMCEIPAIEAKGVHVTMVAPWTETPFLQEGCEWAAAMSSASTSHSGFYRCLDDVWHHIRSEKGISSVVTMTQKSQYELVLNMIKNDAQRSSTQLALLNMSLAARIYSPAVEAHWQLARSAADLLGGCSTERRPFVVVSGSAFCDELLLHEALVSRFADRMSADSEKKDDHDTRGEESRETGILFPELDHIHPKSSGRLVVVLYGIVGDDQTMRLLHTLEPHFHFIRLTFRHLPLRGGWWESDLFVQGYGVTVDLKNVEYKTVDERTDESVDESPQHDKHAMENGMNKDPVGGFDIHLLKQRYPGLKSQLSSFEDFLAEALEMDEVKVDFHIWEIQHMGIAAVQYVMKKPDDDRLNSLLDLLLNFPLHASRLSKEGAMTKGESTGEMRKAIARMSSMLEPGQAVAFLNSRRLALEDLSLFTLLKELKSEEQLFWDMATALTSHRTASVNGSDSTAEMTEATINKQLQWIMQGVSRHVFSSGKTMQDAKPRIWIPSENIIWFNDLARDLEYASMSNNLHDILVTGFNGIPIFPRRNLLHVVCIVDPLTIAGSQSLAAILDMKEQRTPVRLGVVFMDTKWSPNIQVTMDNADIITKPSLSSVTVLITATVWELLKKDIVDEALEFLSELGKLIMTAHGDISKENIHVSAMKFLSISGSRELSDIIVDPAFLHYYHETQKKIHSLQLTGFPLTFINGNMFRGGVMSAMQSGLGLELQHVQKLVHEGKLKDVDDDFYDSILRLSGAKQRYLVSLYKDKKYMNWASEPVMNFLQYRPFLLAPSSVENGSALVSTVLVMRAPVRRHSLDALLKATEHLLRCEEAHDCNSVRLMYAICGTIIHAGRRTLEVDLERLLLLLGNGGKAVGGGVGLELLHEFITLMASNSAQGLDDPALYQDVLSSINFSPDLQKLLESTLSESDIERQETLVNGFCTMHSTSLSENDEEDSNAVHYYANGRRIVISDDVLEEDLQTVILQELPLATAVWSTLKSKEFEKICSDMSQWNINDRVYASINAAIAGLLRHDATRGERTDLQNMFPTAPGPASFVTGPADGTNPRHYLTLVIDPMSRKSQLLVSLCNYVARSSIGGVCTVHFNPTLHVTSPMRNFYQFVDAPLQFDSAGRVVPPAATFHRLPLQHLLTLGIDDPESWMVFPMEAKYDLDNILLSKLPQTSQYLYATYRINSILITGSAVEAETLWPPKGLPLIIRSSADDRSENISEDATTTASSSSKSASVTHDTLVMANLGYFQLQSTPGCWYLTVQPGVIAGAFYISHINNEPVRDGTDGSRHKKFNYAAGQRIPLIVLSFRGVFVSLTVSKVAGYEKASIENLIGESARSAEWPPRGPRTTPPARPTLNIFSVASGHLYERFLRMMIQSVVNSSSNVHGANTTRIKFWLIENFLSPQFKEMVPLMAEHYGFDVGFVTYRWPWWLNRQTEKQRIIWGYKILFLDVLFPLEVERIIFVDADQTVKVDLHELYNMDIGNAPMAYTPFCRKYPNKDTKSFRFWDQGFWLEHLEGKPYHISAIYLVDVRRLRAIWGGDTYRMVYSQLSQDPNSLANLDQDLPNYMQDRVPIYSLPEEWLWCETWCGAESKEWAKTIDLCNNPLTKIPKLENAKRIIPKWEEMDAELEALFEELRKKRQTGGGGVGMEHDEAREEI